MTESHATKSSLLRTIFLTAIITCFIAGYWSAFQKLSIRWSSDDNSYCYLIVPLFIYLCWEKRDAFRFHEFSWSAWGIAPTLFSVCLIVIGELGSVETFLYIGIWGCVVGMAVLFYGFRARFLVFPLIILFFIVPLPPFVNRLLTFKLKVAASTLAAEMLRVSGVSVFLEGVIIDLGLEKLQVVDACSGLRYFIPMIPMSLLIGYFFNRGWWRKLILLFFVVPLSILVNGFRIFVTGLLMINGYRELAQNLFHDFAGWLVFMIAGGLLLASALILEKIGPRRIQDSEKGSPNADSGDKTTGPIKPAVLVFSICLLFVTSGWAVREVPSAKNLPERTNFESFPMELGEWTGKRSYLPQEIMDSLWADDYVSAAYYQKNSMSIIHLLIPFYGYQGTRHTAHAPQSCLLGGGWSLLGSEERIVQVNSAEKIKIMTMVLEKDNIKLLGSYFFFQRGRVITSPWLNKFYLAWDAFIKKRTDGALVRVEIVMGQNQSLETAYIQLEDFISRLWPHLPLYVPI